MTRPGVRGTPCCYACQSNSKFRYAEGRLSAWPWLSPPTMPCPVVCTEFRVAQKVSSTAVNMDCDGLRMLERKHSPRSRRGDLEWRCWRRRRSRDRASNRSGSDELFAPSPGESCGQHTPARSARRKHSRDLLECAETEVPPARAADGRTTPACLTRSPETRGIPRSAQAIPGHRPEVRTPSNRRRASRFRRCGRRPRGRRR